MHQPLQALLDAHPLIGQVDLLIPDMAGVARGKRITLGALRAALAGEATFTSSIYAIDTPGANVDGIGLVWEEGDADRPLALDPATLRPVPWSPGRAQVIGGLTEHDGGPFHADARAVLAGIADRFRALGLKPVAALEYEFYLLDAEPDAEGRPQVAPTARHGGRARESEVYTLERLDDQERFLTLVEEWCDAQDLPYKGALAEFAPGQYEVNLGHRDDMLRAADEALMLKRLVKAAAARTGQRATFMAKPFAEESGSGLHVHVSLVDRSGRNLFGETAEGERMLRHAIAGLQQLMAESMLIFAPNANSYRRFKPLTYAPLTPSWGHNNRTVALRIPPGPPAARRIEHRVAGADAHPYLTLAAVLVGILHGIEQGLEPTRPVSGNAYSGDTAPPLPTSWELALRAFAGAGQLPRLLGEKTCALYGACRQGERDRFQARITPTEFAWYLTTV